MSCLLNIVPLAKWIIVRVLKYQLMDIFRVIRNMKYTILLRFCIVVEEFTDISDISVTQF